MTLDTLVRNIQIYDKSPSFNIMSKKHFTRQKLGPISITSDTWFAPHEFHLLVLKILYV